LKLNKGESGFSIRKVTNGETIVLLFRKENFYKKVYFEKIVFNHMLLFEKCINRNS